MIDHSFTCGYGRGVALTCSCGGIFQVRPKAETEQLEPCEQCGAGRNQPCLEWCGEMVDDRSIP